MKHVLGQELNWYEECVDIPCENACSKICNDNPTDYADCKCLPTGSGEECFTCPKNTYFNSPESGKCIDMTCDEICDKKCTDNPGQYGDCKTYGDNGWGCQCGQCPVGQYIEYNATPIFTLYIQEKSTMKTEIASVLHQKDVVHLR